MYAALAGVLALTCIGIVRGLRATLREGAIWFLCAFVGASVALSTIAILSVSRYVHLNADDYRLPMMMTLVLGVLWSLLVFGLEGTWRQRVMQWFISAVIIASFALSPSWRKGTTELLRPPRHVHRDVANEIGKLIPANSVVVGERSTRTLMGQPFRTATSMPGNNVVPIVRELFRKNPAENVFALLDSQNNYNIGHFQKSRDEFTLIPIKTFKMPSFANGTPSEVYFCKVVPSVSSESGRPNKK